MDKLAIHGGTPVISHQLPHYSSIGDREMNAVAEVIRSGNLSGFYGSWGDEFFGGPVVKQFEKEWVTHFSVKHAVSVNSATSGLFAAMGAVGIRPGDEVIVPPYSMSATAMAPLVYGGIPVFADIEAETFCLDPESVRANITEKTKAIIAVNLFGHPAALAELRTLADQHGVMLVEDNAQSPLATENDRYAGTIGHVGVFSLNYHKHIHTGEGGMCVTDNDDLCLRLQMIRNHAENIVEPLNISNPINMVGFNYRMTEMSAAVGMSQLAGIDQHVGQRAQIAQMLSRGIEGLEGLSSPVVRRNCRHVYYVWAIRVDERVLGVSRERFSEALAAEGFPNFCGYVRPLYLLPLFQRRIAFGDYPFNLTTRRYGKGMCPVTERLYEKELLCFENCMYEVHAGDAERMIEAIRKVHAERGALV